MTCPYQIQNIGKCKLQNRSCNHYEKACYIKEAEITKEETMAEIERLFSKIPRSLNYELTQSQNNGLKNQNIELQSELRNKNEEIQVIKNTIKLSLINLRRGIDMAGLTATNTTVEGINYINWALSTLGKIVDEKALQES